MRSGSRAPQGAEGGTEECPGARPHSPGGSADAAQRPHQQASANEHERLLAIEEGLVKELDLPYRVINVAAGDLGAPAVKKYDIEAWFPGQGRYREITSTSNTTHFQSRRLEIRFRRAGKLEPVHTLNGTAITARAMIAILENFQEADGSIAVPSVLWEFGAPQTMGSKQNHL
jgi:seryl-tRNA synthetase